MQRIDQEDDLHNEPPDASQDTLSKSNMPRYNSARRSLLKGLDGQAGLYIFVNSLAGKLNHMQNLIQGVVYAIEQDVDSCLHECHGCKQGEPKCHADSLTLMPNFKAEDL